MGFLDFSFQRLVCSALVMLISLPFHEFAHGYMAKVLGDSTAERAGRLSLNILRHVDIFGCISMLIFHFGWANPVPINYSNFKNPKRDMAIVAIMGPIANLCLASFALFVYKFLIIPFLFNVHLSMFFLYFIVINVNLAVFNCIPIPPLDGSRLVMYFLSNRYNYIIWNLESFGSIILVVLILSGVLNLPISYMSYAVLNLLNFLVGDISTLNISF